jgi:hypothetical protein
MVVWGGFGTSDYLTDGAAYDPSSDSWTPISNSGAPGGRTMHSTVWTGSQMIVFGGLNGVDAIKTGGRYDPSGDSWTPTSAIAAPFARFSHAAVWTGSQMIIWGGTNTFDWLDHGRVYDPAGDTWGADTSTTNVPFIRESTIAEWSGSEMLIWGGWDGGNYLQSGASLDPTNGSGGSWTTISESGAPSGRARHVSAWTGSQLFVWGGCAGQVCDTVREDGGIWQPGNGGGSWSAVPADANFLGRHEARSVWTGSEVIVWGGRRGNTYLDDGARADLSTF